MPKAHRTNEELSRATRARLVAAAITCIDRYGYPGTTTELIAKHAGTTRGALQYHYADKNDLMRAVVEALYEGQFESFRRTMSPDEPFEKRFAQLVDTSIEISATREHAVFLELWMASRSDSALRKKIGPIIERIEDAIDAGYGQLFPDSTLSTQRLVDLRYITQAALRGLALLRVLQKDDEQFMKRKFELLRTLLLEALKP